MGSPRIPPMNNTIILDINTNTFKIREISNRSHTLKIVASGDVMKTNKNQGARIAA